jgi:hypothetical protein
MKRRSVSRAWVLAGLIWASGELPARAADDPATPLPVRRVVLFTSGVGFFEHQGEVEGDARVDLRFNVDDVNDLLKSMVVEDYGSKDPVQKTLKTFTLDLTAQPTLGQLLEQARGESVELQAVQVLTGLIVGVEHRERQVDDDVVTSDYLTILGDEGLRTIPLETVTRIRLLKPELDAELRQALAVLAAGRGADKKTVSLAFAGPGKRPVRVGYVQESPVWKTSYRLVAKEGQPTKLQGWAIVENTTEEDWRGVRLELVSGRPISFQMDLYEPLYAPRPVVVPELFASLRPQVYNQNLGEELKEDALASREAEGRLQDERKLGRLMAKAAADGPAQRGGQIAGENAPHFLAPAAPANSGAYAGYPGGAGGAAFGVAGVQAAATAADLGNFFRYAIDSPIDIARQQSAMLPIVAGEVETSRVSIYNARVQPKHPLTGLRLKNTSGVHLMQGPLTVYDADAYAGDAQIEDLPPGGERLLSYAIDLDTEVTSEELASSGQLVSVKLSKGVMVTEHRLERAHRYAVKNGGDATKQILIEHPAEAGWKLMAPKEASETTRDVLRFQLAAEPGKPAELIVRTEQVQQQGVAITNLDDATIAIYLQGPVVSEAVKNALREVQERKVAVAAAQAEAARLLAEIEAIAKEQERIRENMSRLDRNTELFNRYVKKLGQQEDQVEELRRQAAQAQAEHAELQQQLDKYLMELELK